MASDQDSILNDLTKIEKELDLLLQDSLGGLVSTSSELINFYSNPLSHSTTASIGDHQMDTFYEKRLTR